MAAEHWDTGIAGRFTDVILDSIADGVFTVDRQWRVTSFNRAAVEITGLPRDEALGRPCREVFRSNICAEDCALRHTMGTGESVHSRNVTIARADGKRLPVSIRTALLRDEDGAIIGGVETFRDLTVVERLRRELLQRSSFDDIISRNHRMQQIFEVLPDIGRAPSTVLIEGPSGSGKELVARAIHRQSPRAGGPMVVVNCGALPDTLLESELFGYEPGAFTDAKRHKPGRFELAEGGTLFLDEIGDITPAMQVRLLRVLQERTYEPLGGTETRHADVRVVAATNRDIDQLVQQGTFREDLFYRLAIVRIALPPLRERREDIPLLVEHFISRMRDRDDREIVGISDEAMSILFQHDFPGNVRELQNVIEHALVLCRGGLIQPQHLPPELRDRVPSTGVWTPATSMEELETRFLYEALARNRFHRAATARELGIHKTTLWRRMRRLKIQVPGR